MQNRIFTFKSGYTVGIRANYSPRLVELALHAWQEKNPMPEPPVELKPVRGGMVEVKRARDPEYLEAVAYWSAQRNLLEFRSKMALAIDKDSLDPEVLAAGRAYYEESGLPVPDDITLYLGVVADRGSQHELRPEIAALYTALQWAAEFKKDNEGLDLITPEIVEKLDVIVKENLGDVGSDDYREDEFALLDRFISKATGPSAALVEHLIKSRFRGGDVAETEHLEGAAAKQRRKVKPA